MNVVVTLSNDKEAAFKYAFNQDIFSDDLICFINSDFSESYDSLISNVNEMDEALDVDIQGVEGKAKKFYEMIKEKKLELIKSAKKICFKCDMNKAFQYIEKNPVIKNMDIVLDCEDEFNPKYIELVESNCKNTSNIYFKLENNSELIKFDEYRTTILKINEIIDEVSKLDLSPLEKIMYVYDIVRDKVYTLAEEGAADSVSRDLTSALLTDKIVCAGYANIFEVILNGIGIDSRQIRSVRKEDKRGHVRTEIYVHDDKYGIDGVYYFDPTWNSKKKDGNNNFLYSYKFFAKTKRQMDEYEENRYSCASFPTFPKNFVNKCSKAVDSNGLAGLTKPMIKSLNHMSSVIDKDNNLTFTNVAVLGCMPDGLIPSNDRVKQIISSLVEKFDKPLSANILLTVLYNVRKYQYYKEPDKYPFDIKVFYSAVVNSGWEFEEDSVYRFFSMLGKVMDKNEVRRLQFNNFYVQEEFDKKIERAKLVNEHRLIKEKKQM